MTTGQAEPTAGSDERPQPALLARVSKVLLRLALVVLLGVALGAGAYFGVTLAIRQLGEPTRQNSARIAALEAQLPEAVSRLAEQQESVAELQVQLEDLQAQLGDQGRGQDQLGSQLTTLADQLEDLTKRIEENTQAHQLRGDLQLTQAMLSLVRARLWLVENNLGLAIAEVERARELLQPLAAEQPEGSNLQAAIERLDFALIELNTRPLVAADDIEIAWKLLVEPDEG
jgi:chromosome segregation ATPase